jgi:hypothetical protein
LRDGDMFCQFPPHEDCDRLGFRRNASTFSPFPLISCLERLWDVSPGSIERQAGVVKLDDGKSGAATGMGVPGGLLRSRPMDGDQANVYVLFCVIVSCHPYTTLYFI